MLNVSIFAERGSQTSQHDEDDHAGPAAEDDGAPHDGPQPKETKTEQSALAWASNGSSRWPPRSTARHGTPRSPNDVQQTPGSGWYDGT